MLGAGGGKGAAYQRLTQQEQNEDLKGSSSTAKVPSKYRRDDQRFEALRSDIPRASIILAVCLAVFGVCSFVLAWLHFTQAILGKEQAEIGFTFLGLITFVPGIYHCHLAWGAWRGYKGYSWDSIPQF